MTPPRQLQAIHVTQGHVYVLRCVETELEMTIEAALVGWVLDKRHPFDWADAAFVIFKLRNQ